MQSSGLPVTIITPCYNEQGVIIRFLEELEAAIYVLQYTFHIVVVNDCSTDDTLALLQKFNFRSAGLRLTVISLKVNVGHQAAIYQGLLYAHSLPGQYYIVMDADGEDTPAVIPELLRHADKDIVHVVRSNRRESILFRFCYSCYKLIFRMVTGRHMNFGNFCLITRSIMNRAVFTNFTHFAAFLSRQQCNRHSVAAGKQERLGGRSKMSLSQHIYHAAKSFAEYGEDSVMAFFKCFVVVMLLLASLVLLAVYHTIPVLLLIIAIAGLINIAFLCLGFFVSGLLLINLHKRNPTPGIPLFEIQRDDHSKEAV